MQVTRLSQPVFTPIFMAECRLVLKPLKMLCESTPIPANYLRIVPNFARFSNKKD